MGKLNRITYYNEISYREVLKKLASKYQAETMIDLGCWDGVFSKEIAKLVGAKKLYGVDHEASILKRFARNFDRTWAGDLNEKLEVKSHSVDLVMANQVVEHLAKTDLFIKEIHRVLKPGGILLLSTPNLSSWHNIGALMLGYQPFSSQVSDEKFIGNPLHPEYQLKINEPQAHLRVFTHYSLSDLCKLHGLEPEITQGAGYYPLAGASANLMARVDKRHSAYIVMSARKRER